MIRVEVEVAIVVNKARPSEAVDKPWKTHNRTNAGTPNGTLTPQYAGEIVWDTTNKVRWLAIGITNADWEPMATEVT